MIDEDKLKSYLLGQLPEAEMAALEQQYFDDSALLDRLVEVENRLVDDHARGRLSGKTLQLFESHYLAHRDRRDRAAFAVALNRRVNQAPVTPQPGASWWSTLANAFRRPGLVWAFSALCLVFFAGIIWLIVERRHLQQEMAQAQARSAQQSEREQQLEKELAQERQWADRLTSELAQAQQSQPSPTPIAPAPPTVAALILQISGVRGAEGPSPARLIIPATADRARLQLILKESDLESYSVMIQAAGGKEIFKQDGLRGHKLSGIIVTVPAHRFVTGDYVLTLKGANRQGELEDVSKSLFHVEKK